VGTDGDDQLGALLVGQQHRDVLAGGRRREGDRLDAEVLHAGQAGGAAVGVGVHDDLGTAAQDVVAHRVHVADDHVRSVAGLDERVGTAVDPDQHRPVVPDVGPQRLQVLLVVVAADDDQHVPALDLGGHVRDADAVEQQRALALHVLHRVGGEGLQLDRQPGPRLGHRLGDRLRGLLGALGEDGAVLQQQPVAVDADRRPLLDRRQHVLADAVDERDAGVDEDLGAEVGVAARRAGRGVDHRGHPAGDQRVGAHPVDVDVVDDRDVPGAQPLGEVLGAAVQPHGAAHSGGRFRRPATAEGADAHGLHSPTEAAGSRPPTRIGDIPVTESVRHHEDDDTPGAPVAPARRSVPPGCLALGG
jgi:hypothetical protein